MRDKDDSTAPEKLDVRSHDVTDDKRQALLRLFPEARTEGAKLDFERLKLALGETVDVGKERYGMNWPGKADCFKTIQQPSLGTLRPYPEESVNFDTTENLIIEGDNLEVLKLLQKSYLGKVKMIYIDPPYNTGNDFIYPDNYAESLQTYLEYTGQVDAEGRKFGTNTETDGRFHSKWMNMMYPRLYLARNLLRDDGVLFASCDDHEVENLKRLGNEVFGEECFLGQITVVNNLKGRNDQRNFATCHEYLIVFGKPGFTAGGQPLTDEQRAEYRYTDKNGNRYALRDLRKRGSGDRREDRPNMYFPVYLSPDQKELRLERRTASDIEIFPTRGDGSEGRWRWGADRVASNLGSIEARMSDRSGRWGLEYRVYLENPYTDATDDVETDEEDEVTERTSKPKSTWIGPEFSTDVGRRSFKAVLPDVNYDYPKPVGLLQRCLYLGLPSRSGIVLDFFSGSGTTAHAVLDLNRQDGGNRKFVLVQLPELTEHNDYKTIAEITKERVRRVIKKLNSDGDGQLDLDAAKAQDRGFRVFKLAESNFKTWEADAPKDATALTAQLELHMDHTRDDRTPDDLLYEILLKSGFPLTTKVEKIELADKAVFSIAGGALLICLDSELTLEAIRSLAAKKPERVVCLDEGFAGNDQLKANAVQIFKTQGVTSFKTV
jgi:adenine-specific DNA-methyltransferase